MDDTLSAFFDITDWVADLLEDPETTKRWKEPSALRGLSVGCLAAHVTMGAAYILRLLDAPGGSGAPRGNVPQCMAAMKMESRRERSTAGVFPVL